MYGADFKNGYAMVLKKDTENEWSEETMTGTINGSKEGVIKRNGEIVVPTEYDTIMTDTDNALITVNGNFIAKKDTDDENLGVYIDKDGFENGTVDWEEAYKATWDFTQGPYIMHDEGKYYYVDKQDKVVIKDVKGHSDYCTYFRENRAAVVERYPAGEDVSEDENGYSGDLYGFMDEKGEMVTDFKFFSPDIQSYRGKYFNNGVVLVRTLPDENGKVSYGYVNKNGKWLVKKEYDMELDYDVRWQE